MELTNCCLSVGYRDCGQSLRCGRARDSATPSSGQDRRDSARRNRTTLRDYDKDLYKARHLIENFFAKLKQYRAIATRYDQRAVNFLATIYLAASVIWLN